MRLFFTLVLIVCLGGVSQSAKAQLLTGYNSPMKSTGASSDFSIDDDDQDVPRLSAPMPQQLLSAPQEAAVSTSNMLTGFTSAGPATQTGEQAPVDLQADNVSYDEDTGVVTASGNVIMVQDGRILRADEISYFLNEDRVRATGNVVLNEVNGDIHFSQSVEFNDKLKNGFVEGLKTYLNDGSRFTAETGQRLNGNETVMSGATYTACEPCKNNPDARLPWRLRASKVTHDEEDARISYKNARFEVYDVPVLYTPYFSHADGTVEQKSGFLAPTLGYSSDLGAYVGNSYYWAIGPDKDATLGLIAMTEQAPLGLLEYRQRWDDASFIFESGLTYSDRTDSVGNQDVAVSDEIRGHVFADGLWDINDKWRSGLEIAYVSDDQYANQYDITSDDVLENRLYAERFSGRNYALGQFQAFQDTRTGDLEADQPKVLPELYASFIGQPGDVPLVKGRWDAQIGYLNLFRDGSGQDMNRASVDLGWERRLVSDYGLVSTVEASVRGDLYHLNDRNIAFAGSGRSEDSTESRFFPQIHMRSSYPVARPFENGQVMIEPLVALTAAPKIDANDDIPNEDSQDVQIDSSNLFNANRFPGADLVEDRTRATYGVLTGYHGYEGSSVEIFAGQSYRFDNDSNPFSSGSGLDQQNSDIVGYVNANYMNRYTVGYRFQLDNDDITFSRNEFDAVANWDRLRLSANYLFAKPLDRTEITENREQLQANLNYYLNNQWRFRTGAVQDLGADPGLRRVIMGMDYYGQCVFWSLTGRRDLTEDESGDNNTEIFFRIGLKNISDFETSGLRNASR